MKKISTYLLLIVYICSFFFSFISFASANETTSTGTGIVINNSLEEENNGTPEIVGEKENSIEELGTSDNPLGDYQGEVKSGEIESSGAIKTNSEESSELSEEEKKEKSSGQTQVSEEKEEEQKFEGKTVFQNPSYILEKSQENISEYTCDEERKECKVNLKFEGYLNAKKLSDSKILCETSFGLDTGEENKCNPRTIIFPSGEHIVNYKIIWKEDENIFVEDSFVIKNRKSQLSSSQGEGDGETDNDSGLSQEGQMNGSGEVDTNSGSIQDNQTETGSWEEIKLPEIHLEIQSGADFGEGNEILCPEKGQGVCKINLDLRGSFGGDLEQKDYICEFDFGSGSSFSDGTDKNCNPGYVDYGSGVFQLGVKISEKGSQQNFREKKFRFEEYFITGFYSSGKLKFKWEKGKRFLIKFRMTGKLKG